MPPLAIAICRVRWLGFVTSWASEIEYEARNMAFVSVGSDGSHLALFQAEGDEPLRQPHHVALRVPDLEAAQAALRAAGVPLRQVGQNLGFEDPEGTVFHFMPAR